MVITICFGAGSFVLMLSETVLVLGARKEFRMDKYAFDHELQVHDAEQFRVSNYEQEHEHQRKFFQPIFFSD